MLRATPRRERSHCPRPCAAARRVPSPPSVGGRSTLAPEPAERGRPAAVQQLRRRDHRRGAGPAAGAGPGRGGGGGPGARRGGRGASKPEKDRAASERASERGEHQHGGAPAAAARRLPPHGRCGEPSAGRLPGPAVLLPSGRGSGTRSARRRGRQSSPPRPPFSFKGTVEICEGSRRKGTPGGSARGEDGLLQPCDHSVPSAALGRLRSGAARGLGTASRARPGAFVRGPLRPGRIPRFVWRAGASPRPASCSFVSPSARWPGDRRA